MNRKLKLYWLKFRRNTFAWNKDHAKVVSIIMPLICMLQYIIPSPFDSNTPSVSSLLVQMTLSILALIMSVYCIIKLPKDGIGYLQFILAFVYYVIIYRLLEIFAPPVQTISVIFAMSLATIGLCHVYFNKGYNRAMLFWTNIRRTHLELLSEELEVDAELRMKLAQLAMKNELLEAKIKQMEKE